MNRASIEPGGGGVNGSFAPLAALNPSTWRLAWQILPTELRMGSAQGEPWDGLPGVSPRRYQGEVMEVEGQEGEDALLDHLRRLGEREVLSVGRLPITTLATWPFSVTSDIIVVQRRRRHYLTRHPELLELERYIIRAVRNPDQVRLGKRDDHTAIFYLRLEIGSWCVVPVWVSDDPARLNSIKTALLVDAQEARRRQKKERLVWQKEIR